MHNTFTSFELVKNNAALSTYYIGDFIGLWIPLPHFQKNFQMYPEATFTIILVSAHFPSTV